MGDRTETKDILKALLKILIPLVLGFALGVFLVRPLVQRGFLATAQWWTNQGMSLLWFVILVSVLVFILVGVIVWILARGVGRALFPRTLPREKDR
jgi:hypothetical protein